VQLLTAVRRILGMKPVRVSRFAAWPEFPPLPDSLVNSEPHRQRLPCYSIMQDYGSLEADIAAQKQRLAVALAILIKG
jgi:hypothetical protein